MRTPSLSTAWNSSRHTDGEAMLREIRELGFEWVELGHGIRFSLWPGVLKAFEAGVVKFTSLHNFCPVPMGILKPSPNCYQFTDLSPALRKSAIHSTINTIQQAAALKAEAVVLHLGWAGPRGVSRQLEKRFQQGGLDDRTYVKTKIDALKKRRKLFPEILARVKECLDPIVQEASQQRIKLGFECRETFEEFPMEDEMDEVLAQYPSETVGYWHDFGHSARKDFLGWHSQEETLRRRRERLIGCHIHDCRAPKEDHIPLGHGDIPFKDLIPILPSTILPVFELSPRVEKEQVLSSRTLWNSFVNASA